MNTIIRLILLLIFSTLFIIETNYTSFEAIITQESPLETPQESRQFNHVHRTGINSVLAQLKLGCTYTFVNLIHRYHAVLEPPSICRISARKASQTFMQTAVLRI